MKINLSSFIMVVGYVRGIPIKGDIDPYNRGSLTNPVDFSAKISSEEVPRIRRILSVKANLSLVGG